MLGRERGHQHHVKHPPFTPSHPGPCLSPLSPTLCFGVFNMGEGDDPGTAWDKLGAGRARWHCSLLFYSQWAGGLGVLLAPPHLQEVQHVLGQLLVLVEDTLPCNQGGGRGVSTPKKHPPKGATGWRLTRM